MAYSTIKRPKLIVALILVSIILGICSVASVSAVKDKYPSPVKENEYVLTVRQTKGGFGTRVKIKKNYYKATVKVKKGYKFTHWKINGKYIFRKGNLYSKTIKLTLRSDCVATPYFKAIKKGLDTTPIKINYSPVSPKTGDIPPDAPNHLFVGLWISFAFVSVVLLGILTGSISALVQRRKNK